MAEKSRTLDPSDPNLQQAGARLQRILWIWAALFIGMALLTYFTLGRDYPLNPLPWLLVGLIMLLALQPATLAIVAVMWALSLISIMPALGFVFGPDPISQVFSGGVVETVGRAAVRIILAITAWNQFLMFRMLYGTKGSTGLPQDLPDIPEVVANRTHLFAWGSLLAGALGVIAALAGLLPLAAQTSLLLVQISFNLSLLALGAGLGAAFSPTTFRRGALIGLLLGALSFLGAMAVGSLLLR